MKYLSIIIPIYNVENYIKNCLRSILLSFNRLDDNMKNKVEVILVNDGSTDDSGKLANIFAEKYDFVKVINQENKGVTVARNTGLSEALGEYVWFVDSDDEVTLDGMKNIVNEISISEDKSDVYLFDAFKMEANIETMWYHFDDEFETSDSGVLNMLTAGSLYFPICKEFIGGKESYVSLAAPWDKVVRREFLAERNIMFDESLSVLDDMIFSVDLFSNAKKVKYIKKKIYKYRYVSDSITHKFSPDRAEKDIKVWRTLWARYQDMSLGEDDELFKQAIYLRIIKSFSICCGLSFYNKQYKKNHKKVNDSVKEVLNLPYYKEAFSSVNDKYAEWRLKPVIYFGRHMNVFGIKCLCYLNRFMLS